jgi:methyl-accepting chemotaxis protein
MKWIIRTPIVRRLLLASIAVAIIPGIVLTLLGNSYIRELNMRGQAVQASTDAVKLASTQFANLQQMNADLLALHAERITAASSPDPNLSITQMEQALNDEIASLRVSVAQGLRQYQRDYQFATSTDTASIQHLLANNGDFPQVATDQQQTLTKILDQEWPDYVKALDQEVLALRSQQSPAQLAAHLPTVDEKYQPLEQDWQHIVNLTESVSDRVAMVDTTQSNMIELIALIAILSITIVVVVVGYTVHLTIARPLRRLALLTRRIRNGETNARAPEGGSDEISLVASSINGMVDNIVRLIQEIQAQRDTLQAQIELLVREISSVGEGNLRVQANVTAQPLSPYSPQPPRGQIDQRGGRNGTLSFSPAQQWREEPEQANAANDFALGAVAESFNYMINELNGLVIRVTWATSEIEHFTALIFQLLAQMVQTGDVQVQQIADATGEVGQMTDFSRQIGGRASTLTRDTHDAQIIVQKGRDAVQGASEGMWRIHKNIRETSGKVQTLGEHSREITSIAQLLANIADQTNLLAQDAATQAKMVGENGKGFSAVAADIQRLSERTHGQVFSINQIVQSVQMYIRQTTEALNTTENESATGLRLTQQAGDALAMIFTSVERQAGEIASIHQMTAQQLQEFNAIEQTMYTISSSTQRINLSTREVARTVEHQARTVEQLNGSVEVFKLRDRDSQKRSPAPRISNSGRISRSGRLSWSSMGSGDNHNQSQSQKGQIPRA